MEHQYCRVHIFLCMQHRSPHQPTGRSTLVSYTSVVLCQNAHSTQYWFSSQTGTKPTFSIRVHHAQGLTKYEHACNYLAQWPLLRQCIIRATTTEKKGIERLVLVASTSNPWYKCESLTLPGGLFSDDDKYSIILPKIEATRALY